MLEIEDLLQQYLNGPSELRAVMDRVEDCALDLRPVEGKWSIREVLCHLADAEIIYADRMKRVIAEDNPTLFDADPNAHVPALVSTTRTAESELAVIEAVRCQMHAILKNSDIEDYQRTAVHSADGPMTLETLLERITGHIPHHISFIEEKLKVM